MVIDVMNELPSVFPISQFGGKFSNENLCLVSVM